MILLAARIVGELLQGPQRPLPNGDGGRQVGECPRPKHGVERDRIRSSTRIARLFGDPALDRRTLGRKPGVAIGLRALAERRHQQTPFVETVLAVPADPAVAQPVTKYLEVRGVRTAGVDRPTGLRAQRVDHESDLVVPRAGVPLRRAQQLGQERMRLWRVEPHQGQERPRERGVFREHMAPPGSDLLRDKAGIDRAPCGEVVPAQRRDQGPRGEAPRCRGLAITSGIRQRVEYFLSGPEPPLENLDEGDLGRMDRRSRRQVQAGFDHRFRGARGLGHMAQTPRQRVVDVVLRQPG